uniref:Serine protease 55 n=1 Tax=Apteryx owenii TaxID=8824 RepID=A0A8B9PX85_APTOW
CLDNSVIFILTYCLMHKLTGEILQLPPCRSSLCRRTPSRKQDQTPLPTSPFLLCGLRPSQGIGERIIGGADAEAGDFPWQVSIQSKGKHFCGGTIISIPERNLSVVVGGVDLSHKLENKKLDSLILHENFDSESLENDIALILLDSPIQFNEQKMPICLPFISDLHVWKDCWVAGWGTTLAASQVLQKVEMKLISREQCLEWIPQLADSMLCAGLEEGGKDACQGDSGGALVCTYGNTMKWFAVGIVSWGEGCGEKQSPGIYTDVYSYLDWIQVETARDGKPFIPGGMENTANNFHVPSSAKAQLEFLESPLLLFIYFLAIRLL